MRGAFIRSIGYRHAELELFARWARRLIASSTHNRATAVRMSAPSGMKVRVFTTDPRGIAAAEAKVVYLPLEIRVRIVVIVGLTIVGVVRLIIGSVNIPSMMRPDMMVG